MNQILIQKLSDGEIAQRGITNWPVWSKGVSRFSYQYDEDEECQIIEGRAIVTTEEGSFVIEAGDFVTFKKGLRCVWDIKDPILKYFNFS